MGLRPKQEDFTVAGGMCQEKCAISTVLGKFRVASFFCSNCHRECLNSRTHKSYVTLSIAKGLPDI